jgi:hypothetical protein
LILGPSFLLLLFLNSAISRFLLGAAHRAPTPDAALGAPDGVRASAATRPRAFDAPPANFDHEHGWCMAMDIPGVFLDRFGWMRVPEMLESIW